MVISLQLFTQLYLDIRNVSLSVTPFLWGTDHFKHKTLTRHLHSPWFAPETMQKFLYIIQL